MVKGNRPNKIVRAIEKRQRTDVHISYVERGKSQPTVAMFIRLCKALNVHPPDLLARIMRSASK